MSRLRLLLIDGPCPNGHALESAPQTLSLDDIVQRFEGLEKDDLKAIFAMFKDIAPPTDKTDQGLLYEELKKVLRVKGVSSPGRHVETWLKTAPEVRAEGGNVADLIRDAEPWDREVDGAELVDDLVAYFGTFMDATEEQELAAALWTVFTHCYDLFDIAAILVFGAPTKGCGKTTFLELIQPVTARALVSSSITGPAVFRTIDKFHPTLLVDEGDKFMALNLELQAILNAGHKRSMAYVIRTIGDAHEPGAFSTWAPKAMTAIGPLPDQLASRSIRIELARMSPAVARTKMMPRRRNIARASEGLQARCARWAQDNAIALRSKDPTFVEGLHLRNADNWEPLLAIAAVCGSSVLARAVKAAALLVGAEDLAGVSDLLLDHIRGAFAEAGNPDELWTQDMLRHLVHRDDGPWASWWSSDVVADKYEGPASKMARNLKPYGLKSKDCRRGEDVRKGYRRADFEPLWDRYVQTPGPQAQASRDTATPQVDGGVNSQQRFDGVAGSQASDQGRSGVAGS